MKIFIYGYWSKQLPKDSSQSLLLQLLEKVAGRKVIITNDIELSDLIIMYPFLTYQARLRIRALSKLIPKMGLTARVETVFGFPHSNVLAVSYENLDNPSWSWFGRLILRHNIPRLTSWPREIDPDGCRFPCWWNGVQHEGFELDEKCYERYGRILDVRKLLRPLEIGSSSKKDAICVLTKHLTFPRNTQIERLRKYKKVDVYMEPDNPWGGSKLSLISKYKYVFCAENSCGYGYETEKLPEVWEAGSIPVGYIFNPLGDFVNSFNSDVLFGESSPCFTQGLIIEPPNIDVVLLYLAEKLKLGGKTGSGFLLRKSNGSS